MLLHTVWKQKGAGCVWTTKDLGTQGGAYQCAVSFIATCEYNPLAELPVHWTDRQNIGKFRSLGSKRQQIKTSK